MQRTLACRRASSLTTAAVPSGELSSTTMNSNGMSPMAFETRSNNDTTLSRSLNVGTITASSGEFQIWGTGSALGSISMVKGRGSGVDAEAGVSRGRVNLQAPRTVPHRRAEFLTLQG